MRNALLIIVAVSLFNVTSFAGSPVDDSGKPELVIIGEPGNVLEKVFASDARFKTIRDNCLYTPLKPSDALYRERYAALISGEAPMLLLQRPGGGVIYGCDANSIPYSTDALLKAMKEAYRKSQEADAGTRQGITQSLASGDCDDGSCVAPVPLYPSADVGSRFNPFDFVKTPQTVVEGWFSDTITWVMIGVGFAIVCGFVLVFALIALGVVLMFLKR